MSNDQWEYHHTTDSGYRVNEDGYDQNGIGHNYDIRPSSNSTSAGSSSDADFESRTMLVIGKLVLLGLVVVVLYKINQFFIKNWVTVAIVLGAFIICAIACFFIIHKGTKKLILKIIFAILASLGIMCAGLSFGPKISETYYNLQLHKSDSYSLEELTAIQEKETIMYGYVTADILNIRAKPSATAEVIGQFSKDDHIEITDNSNSWWLEVKYENSGGYVESVYVRLE